MTQRSQAPELVIFGYDAGHPEYLRRWVREGRLPTLEGIMKRGCCGRIAGPEMVCEEGVWVSLVSGVSRREHGYYWLRQLKPGSYALECRTGRESRALPFWAHGRARERRIAAIDVPYFDPVAGVPGIQLGDWAVHDIPSPPAAEPASLLGEVHRVVGRQARIPDRVATSFAEDRRLHRCFLERIEKKRVLCRHLLAREPFDLQFIVFTEPHAGGHRFWPYRPESQVAGTTAGTALVHALRDIYEAIDREMGRILARLPEDANVVILSPFGMEEHFPTAGLIEAFCRELGYETPAESGAASFQPLALARRLLPEKWRSALSRGVSREKREAWLSDKFRTATNWGQTTAFAILSEYDSFLRVNLKGREPEGIVAPGAEYDAVLQRLEADLKQLIDPRTGRPAVEKVTRLGELYGCTPPEVLPDLHVEWQPADHFMDRLVHPRAELRQQKPDLCRGSFHSRHGFVAAAGPSIAGRGDVGDIDLLDLAPTFLALLGDTAPANLAGSIVERMVTPCAAGRGAVALR